MQQFIHDSPLGPLLVTHNGEALLEIKINPKTLPIDLNTTQPLATAKQQLNEYFEGRRQRFTLPIIIKGTAFQKKVYQALMKIPYGNTQSYADIAHAIGHQKAYRAVGSANHVNRLPIIVPCHRVIGSKGQLVGFRGGLEKKTWLLNHEQNHRGSNVIPS